MNEIKEQLEEKRFFKVLLPSRDSTLKLSELIVLGCCGYQAKYRKPSMTQIAKLTGINRDTVSGIVSGLRGRECLNEDDLKPQYDRCDGDLDTFRGKSGHREFKYFFYYPPSEDSPLKWTAHAIYSFLLGFTGDRLSDRYVGAILAINEETAARHLEFMEKEWMIRRERRGRSYTVGFYQLGDRQLRFFSDAGSKSKYKGVVYLGQPPDTGNSSHSSSTEVRKNERSNSSRESPQMPEVILREAKNKMTEVGIQMLDRDEILEAFRPLALGGVWFDEIHSNCDVFARQRNGGAERYKQAALKTIQKRLQDA